MKLRPGDRVFGDWGDAARVVLGVDRRTVYLTGGGARLAEDLRPARESQERAQDEPPIADPERWRALSEELRRAVREMVLAGEPLERMFVTFSATADLATAELHLTGEDGAVVAYVTCATGSSRSAPAAEKRREAWRCPHGLPSGETCEACGRTSFNQRRGG